MTGGEDAAPRIVVLTLSPALDLTIDVDAIDLGTSHRVGQANGRLGGKGINVARVLAELDRPVYVQGPVNIADWPEAAQSLNPAGPGASVRASTGSNDSLMWDLTDTPADLRRSYALVERSGRATLFNERSSCHPAGVWATIEEKLHARLAEPQVRALAISGSTPVDLPEGFFGRVVSAAHAAGVTVVVDTSGPALFTAAEAGADWLKPNAEELAEITGDLDTAETVASEPVSIDSAGDTAQPSAREFGTADSEGAGAGTLIAAGAGAVLVSRGEEGLELVDRTGLRSRARLDVPVQGNPTGAGDAVVAALLHRLTEGAGSRPHGSSRRAVVDSAGTVGSAATSLIDAGTAESAATNLIDAETAGTGEAKLTDAAVEAILTEAVAVSAAAVLMPQAGAIHPSWSSLRDRVQITSRDDASASLSPPTPPSPPTAPTSPSQQTAPTSPPQRTAPNAPAADDATPAVHPGE